MNSGLDKCPSCQTCNDYLNIFSAITIFLSLLLAISEILGWSNCEWNSITQLLSFGSCIKRKKEIGIVSHNKPVVFPL